MVVDEQGTFREDNFQKAVAALTGTAVDGKGVGGKAGAKGGADGVGLGGKKDTRTGENSDIFKMVKMIIIAVVRRF